MTAAQRSARSLQLSFLIGEALLAAILLILALVFKHHPSPLGVDLTVELNVQHALLPHPLLRDPIEAVSVLNFTLPVIVTLVVLTVLFALLRRWLDTIATLLAAGIQGAVNTAIKDWVRRPRPAGHGIHVVQHITTSLSFPSGHVTYIVTVYGLFLFLTTRIRRPIHPALIWAIRVIALGSILLMPVSRVLEGEHWPSDTLGGAVEGLFLLAIFIHLYLWAERRWPQLLAADERSVPAAGG